MLTSKLIWIVRTLLVIMIVFCAILFTVGLSRDTAGETCHGIMGAQVSCVQEQLFYPIVIGIPIILLLIAILTIDYMSKTTNKIKSKKSEPKPKKK